MDTTTGNLLGTVSGLAIASYVFAVVWQGNTKELGALLYTEEGYIEFIVALFVIGLLMKYGPTSPITDILVVGAVIGVLLRISSKVDLPSILQDFASGKVSGLTTIQTIFKGL